MSIFQKWYVYFFICIAVVMVLPTMYFVNKYRNSESRRIRSIGKYRFDYSVSKGLFDKRDSLEFENLYLILKSDNTFNLSHSTSIFSSKSGVWSIEGSGIHHTLEIKFDSGKRYQGGACCGILDEISFRYRWTENSKFIMDGKIGFIKDRTEDSD